RKVESAHTSLVGRSHDFEGPLLRSKSGILLGPPVVQELVAAQDDPRIRMALDKIGSEAPVTCVHRRSSSFVRSQCRSSSSPRSESRASCKSNVRAQSVC